MPFSSERPYAARSTCDPSSRTILAAYVFRGCAATSSTVFFWISSCKARELRSSVLYSHFTFPFTSSIIIPVSLCSSAYVFSLSFVTSSFVYVRLRLTCWAFSIARIKPFVWDASLYLL